MGHKYILVSEGKRWRDANKDAEKMSGHLVTISSSEEQEFIVNFLRSQKNSPFCTWLGFTDDKKEGDWKWVTGEEVKYTNWGPGQPDNGYGCQNFAWIGWFNDGKWDDNLEGTKLPFIVEFDNSSTGKSRGDIESNDLKVYYGGHTYELSEQKKNWIMAKHDTKKRDGYLVVINTPDEQKVIEKLLEEAKQRENFCEPVWIGFSDEKREGSWKWVNGDKVTFTNWQRNQPSNANGITPENYAVIWQPIDNPSDRGQWNDVAGDNQLRYITEYDFDNSIDGNTRIKIRTTR